jgi:hypothetical protein
MMPVVAEHGILMYDLAGSWCEECGRPKMQRLFGGLTGCATCDEVVTRHRCTKRPDLDPGQSWECPDCGTGWTAREEEATCGECGQGIGTMRTTWDSVAGDRIDSAPRYKPQPWTPLRNAFRETVRAAHSRPSPLSLPKECHRTPGGIMIHVKPGCRCKR